MVNEEIRTDECSFPVNLDDRMSNALKAVSTEFKTVTLLHLNNDLVDAYELKGLVRETRGGGYVPSNTSFEAYCNTLNGLGFVYAQDGNMFNGKSNRVYCLTDEGIQYGVPVAEHVLKWVVDNNLAMYNVLGSQQSSGSVSSPDMRVSILEALLTGPADSFDLLGFFGLNYRRRNSIEKHMFRLRDVGFISFSGDEGKSTKGSEITIKEKGHRFLQEVVYPIREHVSDQLMLDTNLGSNFVEYVVKGMDIAYEASPMINRRMVTEGERKIREYLHLNPSATSDEISRGVGFNLEIVRRLIRGMGEVVSNRIGTGIEYNLSDNRGEQNGN